jgi:hypothetical protein
MQYKMSILVVLNKKNNVKIMTAPD